MRIILTIALLLLSNLFGVMADDFPPPFAARYKLYYGNLPAGEGTRTLRIQDGQYIFESNAEASGLLSLFRNSRIEERSVFKLIEGKVCPIEYVYHQAGKKSKKRHVTFDWTEKLAQSEFDEKTEAVLLKEGMLDKLLYQIVLMQELQQGKRELKYEVVDKEEVDTYIPQFMGNERVKTPLGELETLKYEHVAANKVRRTTFWCAPTLHYLPVKVEHVEKQGDSALSMELQSVEGLR